MQFESRVHAWSRCPATCVFLLLLANGAAAESTDFFEGWESAKSGVYSPNKKPSLIKADAGTWLLGDTVSNFQEDCGASQNTAEVFATGGRRAVRLTSVLTNSDCSDNVYLFLQEVAQLNINIGFSVPIGPDSKISFYESGSLDDPESDSGTCYAVVPPCGDTVSLFLVDNRGNLLIYVLQRAADREEMSPPSPLDESYREIQLDPDAGFYERNVFKDFSTIPNFIASGAEIVVVEFKVQERGTATLAELQIGDGSSGGSGTEPTCAADELAAGGALMQSLLGCSSKYAKNPDKDPQATGLAACGAKAQGKFASTWAKATQACTSDDSAGEVAPALVAQRDELFEVLTEGWDMNNAGDRSVRSALLKGISGLMGSRLSDHAQNLEESHTAGLSTGGLGKAEQKFIAKASKAIAKAEAKGLDYQGPSPEAALIAVNEAVDEIVSSITP